MAEIEAKTFSHLFPYTKLPCICTLPVVRGNRELLQLQASLLLMRASLILITPLLSLNTFLLTTIQIFGVKEDVLCGEGW